MIRLLRKRKRSILTGAPIGENPRAEEPEDDPKYKPIDMAMVKRLMKWMKPYRRHYVAGISLGVVMIGIRMADPIIFQHLVDRLTSFAGNKTDDTAGAATRYCLILIGMSAILQATGVLLDRWRLLVMTFAGENVQNDLRRALFAHLQKLSMSFYDKNKLGRIISRCTSDISSLREVNVWGIDALLLNFMVLVVASFALAAFTDIRLFLSVSWLGVVYFISHRIALRRSGKSWQTVREGYTRVSTNLAENIVGVRVVTAFNRQTPNLDEFNRLQEINTDNNISSSRIQGSYGSALGVLGFLGKAIILVYGGYLVLMHRENISIGKVLAASMYWDWFMYPMRDMGFWFMNYMQAMAGGERVLNLLETQPEVADTPDAKPLPRIVGAVQFEHVTFGYKPDVPVLHDVSFEAKPGQSVALVGHTGSGKSSIISLIARFYQPQQGRILVDGQDIRHVTGESLHRQMGLVLQVNYLFTGTVMDNIRYVRPEATEEQVIEAARVLGTYDAIMSLKDGFKTDVGERGANMSLGQRQLICFTRAYLADPRIFMLDEATSAVDTATELLVQRSLEKLLAGRTTFIVAHRLSTIMRADMILVIDHGKIIERGTHQELLAMDGKYRQLYEQFAYGAAARTEALETVA